MLEDEARNIASSQNPKKHLILQTLYAVISEKRLAENVRFYASAYCVHIFLVLGSVLLFIYLKLFCPRIIENKIEKRGSDNG